MESVTNELPHIAFKVKSFITFNSFSMYGKNIDFHIKKHFQQLPRKIVSKLQFWVN